MFEGGKIVGQSAPGVGATTRPTPAATKPAPPATAPAQAPAPTSPQDLSLVRKIAAAIAADGGGYEKSPQSRLAEDMAITVVNTSTALIDTLQGMKAPLSADDKGKIFGLLKLSEFNVREARDRAATDRSTGGSDADRMDMAELSANLDFAHRNMMETVRKASRDQKFTTPEGLSWVIGALQQAAVDVSQKVSALPPDDEKQFRAAVYKEIKNLKQTDEGTKKLFE